MYPFFLLPIKADANQSLGGGLLLEQPYATLAKSCVRQVLQKRRPERRPLQNKGVFYLKPREMY
jgi:hypothetical protein